MATQDKIDEPTEMLLLAAGSSSRMGQSKQLLTIAGEPLLVSVVKTLLAAGLSQPIVVLGAYEAEHRKVLNSWPAQIISNPHWQKGMGSSLKAGIQFIAVHRKSCQAVIITVCDQPYLNKEHLQKMVEAHRKNPGAIIASGYKNLNGVPVLFCRKHFEMLASLPDQEGAKKILQMHHHEVISIPFPLGAIDLDTMADYNTFIT